MADNHQEHSVLYQQLWERLEMKAKNSKGDIYNIAEGEIGL